MRLIDALAVLLTCTAAAALGWATASVVRILGRHRPALVQAATRCRPPWMAVLVFTAALSATPATRVHGDVESALRHGLILAVIASTT